MFIKARPQDYVSSYHLINTDQIAFMRDCIMCRGQFQQNNQIGLLVEFSNGKSESFQGLSVAKMESILAINHRDAIVVALPEEDINEWMPGPGIDSIKTGNNFGEEMK